MCECIPITVIPEAVEVQDLSVIVQELAKGVLLLIWSQRLHCLGQLWREGSEGMGVEVRGEAYIMSVKSVRVIR